MNCEGCKIELEDYLYGELGEARAAEVRAHLGNCVPCAALWDDLEREDEIFAQFYEQTSIEPAGEMWEAIRRQIGMEPQSRPQNDLEPGWLERLRAGVLGRLIAPAMLRQTAFATLLIVLSVVATTFYLKRGDNGAKDVAGKRTGATPAPQLSVTPSPIPSPSGDVADGGQRPIKDTSAPKTERGGVNRAVPTPQLTDQELMNRQIARAEREYQKAIKMLDQAIAKQRGGLEPDLVKQYESSLALIDGSIEASRRALRERPGDPTAGQFLLAAYAKKIDLMQDIAMR